ncbi:ribulose phosphate epimerase [Nannocystis sp. SCPEA4]|nr:ribulose phosphate epimerase [Nannocystis sp. SCPEA4]
MLFPLLLALACGPQTPMTTDEPASTGEPATMTASGTTTGPATTAPTPTTGTTEPTTGTTAPPTATSEDTAGSTSEGATFIIPPEPCPLASDGELGLRCSQVECSVWQQNCPRGLKCVPYSADGDGAWDSLRCVPIAPDPGQPGQPCTVEGSAATGIDTCDLGVMCWDVDADTLSGTCVAMCEGSPREPVCADPATACASGNDGVLNVCLPACDPLAQDCAADELCIAFGDDFTCNPDGSGDEGQLFDPCGFVNDCDPGLFCAAPAAASECDPNAAGCCLPYCDLDLPPKCPGALQQCLPWYTPGEAPSGHEDLGFCALPQ